jgi:DNA polymerase III subunit gamma/tau
MSYVVLARKYRPRNFAEMTGQDHVVKALSNALTQRRLHHAYLFTGTRGIGKTTVSRILAKSLNCTGADGQGGITAEPCGQCAACRDIDAGRFVDYVELDAASNRGVEEITQLLDQAVYKPVLGRFKVYMIDEVHMLSNTAFNAMLKTLEEPPEYLKFVLATTDPQKVPPTVLSRCLQFNLRPMAPQTVFEHLQRVLAQEDIAAEPGALRLLARSARGSMRDALSLADQAIAYGAGKLDEAPVRQMLGSVDRSHAQHIVEALAAGDGARLVATVDELRAHGLSAAGALEELVALAQEMAVLQAVPDAADASDPDAGVAVRLAGLLPRDETQLLYSIALHGRGELGLAPDEYSGLVMILLRMLAFKTPQAEGERAAQPDAATGTAAPTARAAAQRELAREPARATTTVQTRPTAPPPTSSPAPVRSGAANAQMATAVASTAETATAVASIAPWDDDAPVATQRPAPAPAQAEPAPADPALQALTDRWVALVQQMIERASIAALVRELAWQAQCVAIDDQAAPQRWRLRVERETLRQEAIRAKLETALAGVLQADARLELEPGEAGDSAARRDAAAKAAAQARAELTIRNDPLVVSLLQQFKTARIVPGSIRPIVSSTDPSNTQERNAP